MATRDCTQQQQQLEGGEEGGGHQWQDYLRCALGDDSDATGSATGPRLVRPAQDGDDAMGVGKGEGDDNAWAQHSRRAQQQCDTRRR